MIPLSNFLKKLASMLPYDSGSAYPLPFPCYVGYFFVASAFHFQGITTGYNKKQWDNLLC